VLLELKEYAYAEVDVDFVRKAVRAIGRCALKIESSAERCVAVLVDLIQVPPPPPPIPSLVAHVLVPHALARGATAAGLCAALGFLVHMATLRALGSHGHTLVDDMATLCRPKCRMWCKRPLW
jgi:vesicle coat complex subunit